MHIPIQRIDCCVGYYLHGSVFNTGGIPYNTICTDYYFIIYWIELSLYCENQLNFNKIHLRIRKL